MILIRIPHIKYKILQIIRQRQLCCFDYLDKTALKSFNGYYQTLLDKQKIKRKTGPSPWPICLTRSSASPGPSLICLTKYELSKIPDLKDLNFLHPCLSGPFNTE